MEEPVPRKKRARTTDPADGDDKKRGRPRVEKQDESAADRRRTQIRMAQRAYRQRKESTLEELRKRVSDLSNTIEVMNRLFGDCRDRLFASNLGETQMFDLQDTAAEFEALVKEARNPNEDSSDEVSKPVRKPSTSSKAPEPSTPVLVEPKNVPSWMDQSVIAPSFNPKSRGSMEIGMGYTMFMQENEDQSHSMDLTTFQSDPMSIGQTQTFQQSPKLGNLDLFSADLSDSISIPGSLSPPITYSFQETSIARRIHRACAEAAYQLILDPRRRPAEFERIFRLTLLGRDREKIAESLKKTLDKGPHEDLDFWGAPIIHLGGAGTHYPRRDAFGNFIPKKTAPNMGLIGPQTLAHLENVIRTQGIYTDLTVELAGFEGEWFDPYDVQGYLEEKGIFIDPTSSFAEAEIIEWPQISASGSTTPSNDPKTPPPAIPSPGRTTPLTGTQIEKMITEADADLAQWNDYSNMQLTAVGYSDAASGSWMNFMQPGEGINPIPQQEQPTWEINPSFISNKQPPSPQPKRRSVIIDVSKFVKVMTISGVCLGRTPGFRRRDVDRALAISSFDAF